MSFRHVSSFLMISVLALGCDGGAIGLDDLFGTGTGKGNDIDGDGNEPDADPSADDDLPGAEDLPGADGGPGGPGTNPPGPSYPGIPDGVIDDTVEGENSDGDGYCFFPESGYVPCDDGAPPGSGPPSTNPPDVTPPDEVDPPGPVTPPGGEDPPGPGTPPGGEDPPGPGTPPGGEGPTFTLVEQSYAPEATRPRILLVVDKSGSMAEGAVGFPGSKWQAAVTALGAVTTSLSNDVDLGLMMYPRGPTDADFCAEGDILVDVLPGAGANIQAALAGQAPGGGTPSAAALRKARTALNGLSSEGGQRAVILATDGGPNCNANLNFPQCTCALDYYCINSFGCLDDQGMTSAAQALSNDGIPVFVIGIPGSEDFDGLLENVAAAGGTAQPGRGYYRAEDADALGEAVESIAARVQGCRFVLDQAAVQTQPADVRVGNTVIARDVTLQNGWSFVDAQTVELFGPACTFAATSGADVQVRYSVLAD